MLKGGRGGDIFIFSPHDTGAVFLFVDLVSLGTRTVRPSFEALLHFPTL